MPGLTEHPSSSVMPSLTAYPSPPKAWTPDQVGGDSFDVEDDSFDVEGDRFRVGGQTLATDAKNPRDALFDLFEVCNRDGADFVGQSAFVDGSDMFTSGHGTAF